MLIRRKMRRAVSDAEKTVHERFTNLRDEMTHHLGMLESAKTKRQLTKEEKYIADSIKKCLSSTEHDIISKLDKLEKDAE